MALSDADQARLTALQAAYDALISGKAVARVQTAGGRTVEYAKSDIPTLRTELQALKDQAALPASNTPVRTRGAVRFRV